MKISGVYIIAYKVGARSKLLGRLEGAMTFCVSENQG